MRLIIVLPCYNEEDVIWTSAQRLGVLFEGLVSSGDISRESKMLFVNDGSKDNTWEIIKEISSSTSYSRYISGISLSHNVGHQNALMAGMMTAKQMGADAVITIDADLQDDLSCIVQMINAFKNGYDIVYGVKVSRDSDSWMKRVSAQLFYKIQKKWGGIESVYNHADFRLLSKRALDILSEYGETHLYLRGIVPLIGLNSTTVNDSISNRTAGVSKYTLPKMLGLAIDGITSFSSKPIFLIIRLGIIITIISIFWGLYVILQFFRGHTVPGWASLMVSLWFIGGVIIISIGVIGVYIGKIFQETKHRPRYSIQETLFCAPEDE